MPPVAWLTVRPFAHLRGLQKLAMSRELTGARHRCVAEYSGAFADAHPGITERYCSKRA